MKATWDDTISEFACDLDGICGRRDQLGADIEATFSEHPLGTVLSSLCGFGPRTGARNLAEIGDPHRFADPGLLADCDGQLTNGPTERTNRIIKAVKHQGCGYTNPENYRYRVLYRCA